jgi:hypothetical protein
MRLRTLSALLGSAMIAAVVISSYAQYDQIAQAGVINRNPSTEVLKFHAVMQARLDVQLTQPDLPVMRTPVQTPRVWTVPAVKKARVG